MTNVFSIYITNRKKAKDDSLVNSNVIYNSLYQFLCFIDTEDYSANNSCIADYYNLFTVFSSWLTGKDRRTQDFDEVPAFVHPKLLPHFLHTLRYSNDEETIVKHLIDLKIHLTNDLNSDKKVKQRSNSLLMEQCILKEMVLLWARFEHNPMLSSIIQDSLCILLYNTMDDKAFIETMDYVVTFSVYRLGQDQGTELVITLIQNLFLRINWIDTSILSRNTENIALLLVLLLEVVYHRQLDGVVSAVEREATLEELKWDVAGHFSTHLKHISVEDSKWSTGDEPNFSLLVQSLLFVTPSISFHCASFLLSFLHSIEEFPLILIHSSRIYDLIAILLLNQLYCEEEDIQTLIDVFHVVLKRIKENQQQSQVLLLLFFTTLHRCYHRETHQEKKDLIVVEVMKPAFRSLFSVENYYFSNV